MNLKYSSMITYYPLEKIFSCYEPKIRKAFERATLDAGLTAEGKPSLEIASGTARFEASAPENLVRVNWCAIASVWAFSQAVARITKRGFDARRGGGNNSAPRLNVVGNSSLELAITLFDFSLWIASHPNAAWPDNFPLPCQVEKDEDTIAGDVVAERAFAWILGHEIAHIHFKHALRGSPAMMRQEEHDADRAATLWLKGTYAADAVRPLGETPGPKELELERRALATGIALIWVAHYEKVSVNDDPAYPAIADRMSRCFLFFELREDSGAAEIISDALKAWLDPQGDWSQETDPQSATAMASLMEGLRQLQARVHQTRAGQ